MASKRRRVWGRALKQENGFKSRRHVLGGGVQIGSETDRATGMTEGTGAERRGRLGGVAVMEYG